MKPKKHHSIALESNIFILDTLYSILKILIIQNLLEFIIINLQESFIFFLQGILDIDPTKYQSERHKYICHIPECSETFSKDQDLIFHIGETHNILNEIILNGIQFPKNKYVKQLEVTDYLPKPYNRDGIEIRYLYIF